jgi:hypothetical protein
VPLTVVASPCDPPSTVTRPPESAELDGPDEPADLGASPLAPCHQEPAGPLESPQPYSHLATGHNPLARRLPEGTAR